MAIVGQSNWRYCNKCFGLWFNGNPTNGVCPAGGAHTSSGSFDYLLAANDFRGVVAADAEEAAAGEDS
ncbi:hypothetical protein ACIRD3_12620 [Kitasatospora sp. NPDC093550]|uniref:hypothetical protein n=1 Tax=Kitasatospora sp. NPDC093550 TaxID=3364089 RepID=UPI0037FA90DB